MTDLGTAASPFRVAIIGAGPSGFYAAEALFKSNLGIQVDLIDRLPTPYGLVRGGVAPDHAKIKSVTRVYERIATHPDFGFIGNVNVGRDVTVNELRTFYDAIVFACGAESDNRLGIPGEDLPGSHTATEFVGWYNGHPDYVDRLFDLSQEVAVVVGQGNVAMDVCRILAKTADELRVTDIAEHALDALAASRVREVHLFGRRGPVQAKFTPPEIREFGELAACETIVRPEDLILDKGSRAELDDPSNIQTQKNYEALQAFAKERQLSAPRKLFIHFLRSPIAMYGSKRLERVEWERNRLEGTPFQMKAVGTGQFESMDCGLLFRSVGYRGLPMPGVPFDDRKGIIPNREGRVLDGGDVLPRLYVAGWIKRGPSGVIGTNKPDSHETAHAVIQDLSALARHELPSTRALISLLKQRGIRTVSFDDWRRIDEAEVERGKTRNKPREKFTRIEEMLAVLDTATSPAP
ncbi:MAG: pyridine nucleotide-disulfide oxidoreductase [Candidatus Hydrogenedentota bacterium]